MTDASARCLDRAAGAADGFDVTDAVLVGRRSLVLFGAPAAIARGSTRAVPRWVARDGSRLLVPADRPELFRATLLRTTLPPTKYTGDLGAGEAALRRVDRLYEALVAEGQPKYQARLEEARANATRRWRADPLGAPDLSAGTLRPNGRESPCSDSTHCHSGRPGRDGTSREDF